MTTHVLILCTHNSARSVLAEGMLAHLAAKCCSMPSASTLRAELWLHRMRTWVVIGTPSAAFSSKRLRP